MDKSEHQLLLIEFFLHNINIPCFKTISQETRSLKTVVTFEILELPPINIEQEDKCDDCIDGDCEIKSFSKGKSCLFAMPSVALEKPISSFPITATVKKIMPFNTLPDVFVIGKAIIQIKNLINSIIEQMNEKIDKPSDALKSTFEVKTDTGKEVGHLTLFLRATCLGSKIITQFCAPNNKYLFKGAKDNSVFRCKTIKKDQCHEDFDIQPLNAPSPFDVHFVEYEKRDCPPPKKLVEECENYTYDFQKKKEELYNKKCFTPVKETVKKCGCVAKSK